MHVVDEHQQAGELHRLRDAELVGRLDRVDRVAAGVGEAEDLRLAAWACSRKELKSLAESGWRTEPTMVPPAALTTVEVSF
jgi:hypothetical protein